MNLVMILAPGFEELEAVGTADVLARLGITVTFAGLESIKITGAHNMILAAHHKLEDLICSEYDGVILPGGLPGSTNLLNSDLVIRWVKEMKLNNKITAAICAAPMVLDKAGLLEKCDFTMYPAEDLYKYLRDNKRPLNDMVVVDGKVITGKGPGATFKFAAAIAETLQISPSVISGVLDGMFVNQ